MRKMCFFSLIKDDCQFCGVLLDEPNQLYFVGLLLGSRAKLVKPKTIFFVLTNALFFSLGCTEN